MMKDYILIDLKVEPLNKEGFNIWVYEQWFTPSACLFEEFQYPYVERFDKTKWYHTAYMSNPSVDCKQLEKTLRDKIDLDILAMKIKDSYKYRETNNMHLMYQKEKRLKRKIENKLLREQHKKVE